MRWRCIGLALAIISSMLGGTTKATAQTPTSYTYQRAYLHFAGSRYSYRALYSSVPASGSVAATPFFYQGQYVEPSFSRQRITPFAYERFDVIPGLGGTMLTPFSFSSFYAPGYGHGLYAPYGMPAIEYFYP